MSSTPAPNPHKHEHKAVKDKPAIDKLPEAQWMLVKNLETHYGIQFDGDKDKFIHKCNDAHKKLVKSGSADDPREEAANDENIAKLRVMWTNYDEGKKETDEQSALREALSDAGISAVVSFPDEDSYVLNVGGREDSGHLSQGPDAIVAAAKRLTNRDE